jgi:hypothetical protein
VLPILAKVDPLRIVIDRHLLKPTDWDLKVVEADLIEYVQLTRLIKATPILRCIDGDLVVVSGEPFVRAAQEVKPPLKEVVCLIECTEELVLPREFTIVTASEMLDEQSPDETYDAIEILVFTRSLTDEERKAVELAVVGFFNEVSADSASYGGNYSSLSSFNWDSQQSKVKWIWQRNDQFGRHALTFLSLLRDLDRNTAPLSSWNGLALHGGI